MAGFTLVGADTRPASELHAAFVGAFSDYVTGPVQLAPGQWPGLVARQGVVEALSRVAVCEGRVVAFGLVCPRPETGRWRLGAMGTLPAARGSGAAAALLDDAIARAAAGGATAVELECFAANERALRLYRGRGFAAVAELNGWQAADGPAPAPAGDVQVLERAAGLAWLAEANRRVADLPFQCSERSLAVQPRPLTFWRRGEALLAFSVVEGTPTTIHALVDLDAALHDAEALARALRAAHPDASAPPLLPDTVGGAALGRAGFARQPLGQLLMTRAL